MPSYETLTVDDVDPVQVQRAEATQGRTLPHRVVFLLTAALLVAVGIVAAASDFTQPSAFTPGTSLSWADEYTVSDSPC